MHRQFNAREKSKGCYRIKVLLLVSVFIADHNTKTEAITQTSLCQLKLAISLFDQINNYYGLLQTIWIVWIYAFWKHKWGAKMLWNFSWKLQMKLQREITHRCHCLHCGYSKCYKWLFGWNNNILQRNKRKHSREYRFGGRNFLG